MQRIALFVLLAFVFLGGNLAYAMGGGGSHGDGRTDFMQKPGENDGSAPNACAQDTGRGTTGFSASATRLVEVSVPEPDTLLFLGSALIGLVVLTRKVRK